jgi:hypothetical protein
MRFFNEAANISSFPEKEHIHSIRGRSVTGVNGIIEIIQNVLRIYNQRRGGEKFWLWIYTIHTMKAHLFPFFVKFSAVRRLPCTMIQQKEFIFRREGPFHIIGQIIEQGGPKDSTISC